MIDRTMIQFDYEEAHGRTVTAVLGQRDGDAGWQSVAVVLGDRAMVLRVDPDTDEITVTSEEVTGMAEGWTNIAEMAEAVASALGWCWIGRNYLGYLDMFTVSFSGLEPQFCFTGEASNLAIGRITPLS